MLATLEGDRLGCCLGSDLPMASGFSNHIANVSQYDFANYANFSPNELNGLKLKIKGPKFKLNAPKAPKFKFAPKIKVKIKNPIKGVNLNKAAHNFIKPFESIGASAGGLVQSALQAPQDLLQSGTGLVSNIADSASGLVSQVADAAGQMAPELIKGGLNALAPGAGSLLDAFTGGSPSFASDPSAQYQEAVLAASDAANQIPTEPLATNKPNYLLYGGLGLAGISLIYLATRKKGKR